MRLPFVQTVIRLAETASTNDDARLAILDGSAPLPLLVVADRQTAGRGRGSNSWWSDCGSLTMTIALDPASHGLRPHHEPMLALATAVAIIDVLSPQLPDGLLGIRWPNDVEVGGRKLAGILPERVDSPSGPRLLIGIGLNISTRLEDAPEEVRAMATSVDLLRTDGRSTTPEAYIESLLEMFSSVIGRLASDDPALADRWSRLDLLRGRPMQVDLGDRIVSGMGDGILDTGAIRIITEAGSMTLFGGRVLREG